MKSKNSLKKFDQIISQIFKQIDPAQTKWMLVGSYALALQNLFFKDKLPKDIDIIVPLSKELDIFEDTFKEYITSPRTIIESTGGEQTKFEINGIEVEVFWETEGATYSRFIDQAIYINRIPLISVKNEWASKKLLIALPQRGAFGDDLEKIDWLSKQF